MKDITDKAIQKGKKTVRIYLQHTKQSYHEYIKNAFKSI